MQYHVVAITANPAKPDDGVTESIPFILETDINGYDIDSETDARNWVRNWLTTSGLHVVDVITQVNAP